MILWVGAAMCVILLVLYLVIGIGALFIRKAK